MEAWNGDAGNILFTEKIRSPSSPVEAIGPNASQAVKTLLVGWDNRQTQAAEVILGGSDVAVSGSSFKYITRYRPMPHPDWIRSDGSYFMWATKINRVTGVTAPKDLQYMSVNYPPTSRYRFAEMEVQFETLPYDIVSDNDMPQLNGGPDEATLQRYCEVFVAPAADYLTLPEGAFKWAGTTIPVPGRPGKIVPKALITVVHHQVPKAAVGSTLINPGLNTPYIDRMVGRVNVDTWPAGAAVPYPLGTCLYLAPVIEPMRSSFGDRIYTVKHRILLLQVKDTTSAVRGHNWLYRNISGGTSGYYEVSGDGLTNNTHIDGRSIYDWGNLNDVFRVPPN